MAPHKDFSYQKTMKHISKTTTNYNKILPTILKFT